MSTKAFPCLSLPGQPFFEGSEADNQAEAEQSGTPGRATPITSAAVRRQDRLSQTILTA
jgi:hypothetical protein